jgi:hypothetical protein
VNYSVTAGSVTLTWNKIAKIKYYNIYRSIIYSDGTKMTRAAQLGFLGRSYGPVFTDNNIIPDYTTSPPQANNPFANSKIEHIDVTAGGTGYTNASVLSVTDAAGIDFVGFPVVESGVIVAVVIVNNGSGYVSPVISATVGTGATFTAEIGEASGNYPRTSVLHQQRQLFAGAGNFPLTIDGSRPGLFNNFDYSEISSDGDAYEHEIDSKIVAHIRHLIPTRIGLLAMTRAGIWLLRGSQGGPVTATDAQSDPHPFTGVSDVPPLKIDADILYAEDKSGTVRLLGYNEITKVFNGSDTSILSSHLIGRDKKITSWAYAAEPHRLVLSTREDGTLLCTTLVKEQEVIAWTWAQTRGWFRNVVSLQENTEDIVYFAVERASPDGSFSFFALEKAVMRDVEDLEDTVCLDSSLSLPATYLGAGVIMSGSSGVITLEADADVFAPSGDDSLIIGAVFRGNGAKGTVLSGIDPRHVEIELIRDCMTFIPETNIPAPLFEGEWTFDLPVDTVSGLDHLEGQTVRVFADGSEQTDKVVVDGTITLDEEATRVTVGLPFTMIIRSLPINTTQAVIDEKRKRVVAVGLRVYNTKGLKAGASLDRLYPVKERTIEPLGEPTLLQTGLQHVFIEPRWDNEGQFYLVQESPFPVTLLGLVADTEVGDDTD